MKGSCTFVASMLAASTAALSSSTSTSPPPPPPPSSSSPSSKKGENDGSKIEKFAPRFDGLRFIQTLVTAHR